MKIVKVSMLILLFGGMASSAGLGTTAEEILDRVEEQGFLGLGAGDFEGAFSVTAHEPGEEPEMYSVRVWSREEPDGTVKTTMLYESPELVAGTVFLFHSFVDEDPRLWLMLPELGVVNELVGGGLEQEFVAGLGITYEEIAEGFSYREGYESEILEEASLDGIRCWKLMVQPTEPETADWESIVLWVHREKYVVMRADFEDETGATTRRMTAEELDEDALGTVPRLIVVEDLQDGARAEIRIRERSRKEVPQEVFAPEYLPKLEP